MAQDPGNPAHHEPVPDGPAGAGGGVRGGGVGTTDEDLVRAVKAGEAGAWVDLARRTLPRVYALSYRMLGSREEAADASQTTLLKLVQAIGQYDHRSRFSTWVYRIATNVCISRLRSARVRKAVSLEALGETPPWSGGGGGRGQAQGREPEPSLGVERSEQARRLSQALRRLEPEQRAILILRDGQDMSYERIADVLGIGLGTVKSRLFRARLALRTIMEESESDPGPVASRVWAPAEPELP